MDFYRSFTFLKKGLLYYNLLIISGIFFLPSIIPITISVQKPDPEESIQQLKTGYLLIRMPTQKAKIDTLTAMALRTQDLKNKERLEKELQKAKGERDSLMADYTRAFKNHYSFSQVAYYLDYEGKNLPNATFYDMDHQKVDIQSIKQLPIFYLFFESTSDSRQEALVIYNNENKIVPPPFPNNFSLGGFNSLFLSLMGQSYAEWRVKKIQKQLNYFYQDVMARKEP